MLALLLLFTIVLANISLFAILARLNLRHREFFVQMVSEGIPGSSTWTIFSEFILKSQYAELNDPLLTAFCRLLKLSFLASLTLMVITAVQYGHLNR